MRLFLALCLMTLIFTTGCNCPCSTGDALGAGSDSKSQQEENYDAHRPYTRYHFDDDEMDFALQWVLGSVTNGGAEIGEAFYVAGSIKDGDPLSWQTEWEKMAVRKEARADKAIKEGHKTTARECYIKASNYYRTALVSMDPTIEKFDTMGAKVRGCMKKAAKLFTPEMVYFEVPFEDTVMPGFYLPIKKGGTPRKTLLMIGGGETFIEDNIVYIQPQTTNRGYNFITVDIPGQ